MAVVRGESEKQDGTWTKTYTYYATDHLDTVRFDYELDASGNVLSQSVHDYSPFGLEIVPTETSDNTHKYTGQERDPETGNDYMHYRFYGDSIGRFMKPDNVSGTMENPQDWNLYSYTHGNPINSDDPTGHGRIRTRMAGYCVVPDTPKKKEREQKALTAKSSPKATANQQAQQEADQQTGTKSPSKKDSSLHPITPTTWDLIWDIHGGAQTKASKKEAKREEIKLKKWAAIVAKGYGMHPRATRNIVLGCMVAGAVLGKGALGAGIGLGVGLVAAATADYEWGKGNVKGQDAPPGGRSGKKADEEEEPPEPPVAPSY